MQKNIRLISAASVIEGLAAFIWLAFIPTEASFFSPLRMGFLFAILAISAGWLFIYFQKGITIRAAQRLLNWRGKYILAGLCICLPLLILSAAQWSAGSLDIGEAAFARLLPVLVWGVLISSQFGAVLVFSDRDAEAIQTSILHLLKPTIILLICFLLIWAFVSITKIGITKDIVGLSWGPPGTPITFGQVTLVFTIGACIMVPFWLFFRKRRQPTWLLDTTIFVGLWALAVFLWWKQPMLPSHFAPEPMPPNFEYYPNSDAAVFDRASYQLVLGTGFKNQLVRRPLFVELLALLHSIAGPGYDETVFLQILLLAFIPALVYLLTVRISNRLAGLLSGGLIVLREANAIHLSRAIPTSHAKLLMTDLATMLSIVAILYLAITLLEKRVRNPSWFAVLGACLGLTMLVRAQTIIILAPILFFVILGQRPFKTGIYQSLIVLLGLALILLPWVWRNWNLTGTLLIDDRTEERLMARNYSKEPTSFPVQMPDETEREFVARMNREILAYLSTHPADVLFFVSNHFFHNVIDSAIYIAPVYSSDSPREMLSHIPYWGNWDGRIPSASGVPISINLVFLALGIAFAQQRHKLAGWLPLAVFIFYSGGNALARTSGWRFILPVDWIILMYFCIGLAYLPSGIGRILQNKPKHRDLSTASRPRSYWPPTIFALLFVAGASLPIAEQLIPNGNFENFTNAAKGILDQKGILNQAELDKFRQQENAIVVSGIALYPRYFPPNARLDLAGMPTDYTYLHFWFISPITEQTALPIQDISSAIPRTTAGQTVLPLQDVPSRIPHTATITIIGCKNTNYISAWAVIAHSQPTQILLREPQAPLECPLIEPN